MAYSTGNTSSIIRNVTHAAAAAPTIVCYEPTKIVAPGIWDGTNPLDYALPLFVVQLVIVVLTTRLVFLLLKPFRQPRVVAEIIGGIILGPSGVGHITNFADKIFPTRSQLTLETVAHLALLYFLFLVGVEMDVRVIRHMGRKALVIAFAGMAIPFTVGVSAAFAFGHQISHNVHQASFCLFLGVALSVTAFPVLARILAEIKLLHSELGRIAMASAIINDLCAWVLLALAITVAGPHEKALLTCLWLLLSSAAFVLFCFYAVRPAMRWLVLRIPDGEGVSDFHVCLILTGVMLSGLVTDAIGVNSVFGAFVFGLVVPNGVLGEALIEKLEDFITGLLLPLFFTISGLRTDVTKMEHPVIVGLLVLMFVLATIGKVAGTILIALSYSMPVREGFALGFLMNTRGLVEMIILNIGREREVLNDESFAVMVLMSLLTTAVVTPVVINAHRPAHRFLGYRRRTLQRSKPDTELRMLACVHATRNVPPLIGLLDVSNPTKRSPIFAYVIHLLELTGRATAMIAVHNSAPGSKPTSSAAPSSSIFAAFDSYEQHAGGVSVHPVTAVSPYPTMHDDICNLAEDKHVAIIILPFHKHQAIDGTMEAAPNPHIRTVNQNVLSNSPCSVGILVDRGLGAAAARTAVGLVSHHVAVLFFGGPDDREALAYAWRMAEHPGVGLAVVRFLSGPGSPMTAATPSLPEDPRAISIVTDGDRERQMDEDYFSEFRLKNVSNESVVYMEKVVGSSEETVSAIRSMDSIYDLYVVGRSQQGEAAAPMTAGLTEWTECPELGPIGDLLASSDFAATVSVLVVQQYVGAAAEAPEHRYLFNANQRVGMGVGWNGR